MGGEGSETSIVSVKDGIGFETYPIGIGRR